MQWLKHQLNSSIVFGNSFYEKLEIQKQDSQRKVRCRTFGPLHTPKTHYLCTIIANQKHKIGVSHTS